MSCDYSRQSSLQSTLVILKLGAIYRVSLDLDAMCMLNWCYNRIIMTTNFCLHAGTAVFLSHPRAKSSFLVEYSAELITAEEGYHREEELDDNSVFRYYFQHKKKTTCGI